MKTWPTDPQDIYKVGYQGVNLYEPPTWIQLTIGEGITEAFGRYAMDFLLIKYLSESPVQQNSQESIQSEEHMVEHYLTLPLLHILTGCVTLLVFL